MSQADKSQRQCGAMMDYNHVEESGGTDNCVFIDVSKEKSQSPPLIHEHQLDENEIQVSVSPSKYEDAEDQISQQQKEIYILKKQLDIMKSRLQKQSHILFQERQRRAEADHAASVYCSKVQEMQKTLDKERQLRLEAVQSASVFWDEIQELEKDLDNERQAKEEADKYADEYWDKIQEMQTTLDNEQQLRLSNENELRLCKEIIANLLKSPKTSESQNQETQNLKSEPQEKTNYIQQLASKVRAQEDQTELLQLKVAKLTKTVEQLVTVSKIDISAGTEDFHCEIEEVSEGAGTNEIRVVSKPKEISEQDKSKNTENVPGTMFTQPEEDEPLCGPPIVVHSEVQDDEKNFAPDEKQDKPSLWRRFTKFMTPKCRRQNKDKKKYQLQQAEQETAELKRSNSNGTV